MSSVESELAPLHVPRLAALATSAWPVWLWSADASRILWTNAVGAAIFGASTAPDAGKFRFGPRDPSAAQITRLAATLPSGAQERLERLRGFGAGFGRALMCVCSRLVLPGGSAAVLIAATEPAGPVLSLRDRVRRLFPDGSKGIAAFAPSGTLIHANAAALQSLGGATTLSALGIEILAASALDSGHASGTAHIGPDNVQVTATRLGKDESSVLVITLPPPPTVAAPTQAASPAASPAPVETPPVHVEAPPIAPIAAAPPIAATETPQTAAGPAPAADVPVTERRHPLRFVWQMDANGRFVVGSDEFVELVGPRTTAACGRLWSEIAAELKLDPGNQVVRALATHETWSGIQISWPIDDSDERLPVELSGLPVFDRDRSFQGYRGFGVCRDVDRINHLARARRARPIGFISPAEMTAAHAAAAAAPPQDLATAEPPTEPAVPVAAPQTAAPSLSLKPAEATTAEAVEEEQPLPAAGPPANVVPFRPAPTATPSSPPAAETKAPTLSPVERNAFSELAQELAARLRGSPDETTIEGGAQSAGTNNQTTPAAADAETASPPSVEQTPAPEQAVASVAADIAPIATDAFVDTSGATAPPPPQPPITESALLDRVPAGVLVHRNGAPVYANRHFFELSGYDTLEALTEAGGLDALFATPGPGALADDGGAHKLSITTHGGENVAVEGRLFSIPWGDSSALALVLSSAQAEERRRAAELALGAAENEIRDLKSEIERTSRREAHKAATAKADFLAKVSHEIRTPLNSMIGFAEVIMAERFGSIGNERYREYLKDMHAAGTHLVSLLNDLLDLSKIETGQLELTFADLDLNDLTQQCVGIMQPQANRARIIIRSALTPGLQPVMADARSIRQIVLNLLTNAIKFTGPGGQVIVSTARADGGEVVLRVRDTGVGMREKDIEAVLDPFQESGSPGGWGAAGTGLGLPLTKALAEANRLNFSIKSAPNAGTLVEIAFPSNRTIAR